MGLDWPRSASFYLRSIFTGAEHSNGAASATGVSRVRNIDRQEPCFITKSAAYTHERAHWVNAVRNDPAVKRRVERLLIDRRVVHDYFVLDDVSNLTNLDRSLHAALDKYAFFAVTCSLRTLDALISALEADNDHRQREYDRRMQDLRRNIDLTLPPVSNAQYELVVLRPEHFLPDHSVLTVYDRAGGVPVIKTYMIGPDRVLRQSPADNDTCERFPSFTFDYDRDPSPPLNPFLVILNAEIKFRRYLREISAPVVFPDDVRELMDKTIQLVGLIYWDPVLRENTPAKFVVDAMKVGGVLKVPQSAPMGEMSMRSDEEDNGPTLRQRRTPNVGRRRRGSPTLEERRDYGQYLLSGRNLPDSEDECSEELQSESDDQEVPDTTPLDNADNWQRTVEVQ